MKKISRMLSLMITAFIVITAASAPLYAADTTEVQLGATTTSVSMEKGTSRTLKTSLTGKVTWTSSKTSVATVSASGKVTAKNLGTTVITAKNSSKSQQFKVTVTSKNLIKNGDASQGLKYWVDKQGVWETRTEYDNTVFAYDSYFFMPRGFKGKDGAKTRIYQDLSIKGYQGRKATLSAYNRTWTDGHKDVSIIRVDFYDTSGTIVGSAVKTAPHNAAWTKISASNKIPANAVKARVSLYSIYHQGSESDSYFDQITLVVS